MKNKRAGFTLMEVIIAISLFTVFTVGSLMIMQPVLSTYRATADLADAQSVAANICETVRGELVFANGEVTAEEDSLSFSGKSGRTVSFTVQEGRLYKNGKPVYDEKYYEKKTVSLSVTRSGDIFTISVQAFGSEGEGLYTSRAAVTPVALLT